MVYKILIPYGINFVYPPNPIISIGLSMINTNVNSMAKKLKQGQKYPDGFTQRQILLKLCEKDRTPTSEILDFLKDRFGIREQKNIREHHLKILEKQKLIKKESAGRGHPDYWSVISDFKVLEETIERIKDYPRAHHDFMKSEYYRSWIPELVDVLNYSFTDTGLTRTDIEHAGDDPNFVKNHIKTCAGVESVKRDIKAVESGKYDKELIKDGRTKKDVVAGLKKYLVELESYDPDPDPPYTFSNSELKAITKALEYNWTMLRFIIYYLSIDDVKTKRKLLTTLATDARRIPPAAAVIDTIGRMILIMQKFIGDNNLQISGTIPDEYRLEGFDISTVDGMIRGISIKARENLVGPDDIPTLWFADFFDLLFVVRDRYRFAFD